MVRQIERDEVQRLLSEGAQLLDVLSAREYAEEHLAGAISLPAAGLRADTVRELRPDRPVVVYCYDRE